MLEKIISYKKYGYLLAVLMLFQFCAKKEVISDVEFQRQLLSGTGTYQNLEHSWRLDSTYINGVSVALTAYQRTFTKTFVHDGISDRNTAMRF